MKQNLYVKSENKVFSNLSMILLIFITSSFISLTYTLNLELIFGNLICSIFYYFSIVLILFSLYQIFIVKKLSYIYLNDDEIWFKDQNETVCLKYELIDHFETRFSEIVFCTKEENKVILPLNQIKDEKKRWEIKEFLRDHIKQIRDSKAILLASA